MSKGHATFPAGPVIVGSIGLATGVAGLTVRILGQSSYNAAIAGCTGGACSRQSDVDNANAARQQVVVGTVVIGIGVAELAAAALWWVLMPRGARMHAGVIPTRDGPAAFLVGRF